MPLTHVQPALKGVSDAQLAKRARDTFLPLDVVADKQYLLSLRHGKLLEKQLLLQLLKGGL